jgi:hypothetical protein
MNLKLKMALIIVLFSVKINAQETTEEQADNNTVSVIANWYKNDTFYYRNTNTTLFYDGDNVKDSTRFTTILRLIIRDSTKSNYKLEAQIVDDPENKNISHDLDVAADFCIPTNFKLIFKYTTDEKGVLEKFDNLEEVKLSFSKMMPQFDKIFLGMLKKKKGIEGKEAEKLLPIFREGLLKEDKIIENFFWSNQLMHTNYGLQFKLNDTIEYIDTTIVTAPFNGKNVALGYPMDGTFFAELDSNNIISLEFAQNLDNDACSNLTLKTLVNEGIFNQKQATDTTFVNDYKESIKELILGKFFNQYIGNDGILLYAKSDNYVKNKNEDKSIIKKVSLIDEEDEIKQVRKLFK